MDETCARWGVKEEALREFKEWFSQQAHLPRNTPDEYLAQFLHSCYFDLERAKKAIDVYFRLKTETPEFFSGRTLEDEGFFKVTKVCQVCLLPEPTERGYTVIMGRLVDTTPSHLVLEDSIKYLYALVDLALRERPACPGIVFAFDLSGYSFRHLLRISMSTTRKYFEYVQDGCPMRHKGMHFLNASSVVTHLLTLARPFMYKEHAKKLNFYNNSNLETMTKFLSTKNIPKDYGGEAPTMAKLQEDTLKRVKAYESWFKFDETLRVTKGK